MRSALYECTVAHERFEPARHAFRYRVFTFCLELDEIDALVQKVPFVSRNRFNLFSYYDRDHLDVVPLLRQNGILETPHRIQLITNLRILGYVFNPVSFYYCYDAEGRPFAAVAEVNNTFGETKAYVIRTGEAGRGGRLLSTRQPKEFYISPFVDLDVDLQIDLSVPGDSLAVAVTDMKGETKLLRATMSGRRKALTTGRLAWFAVKYPFLTLKVIAAIHWEAALLWLKGVPFRRKSEKPELQRGIATAPAHRRRGGTAIGSRAAAAGRGR